MRIFFIHAITAAIAIVGLTVWSPLTNKSFADSATPTTALVTTTPDSTATPNNHETEDPLPWIIGIGLPACLLIIVIGVLIAMGNVDPY